MRRITLAGLLTAVALLATTALAFAAEGWIEKPGSATYDRNTGIVTLINHAGEGTSYEHPNLPVEIDNGDTISFEYMSEDVACAGGVPRVFVQGGAYNTFDADPAGPGACGTDADGDGWYTVTGTIDGVTPGPAGHTGIVNDNPADPGTIQVRNLLINGVAVLPNRAPQNKEQCKNGGWQYGDYKNQGACVSSFAKAK